LGGLGSNFAALDRFSKKNPGGCVSWIICDRVRMILQPKFVIAQHFGLLNAPFS
jgi:hypothetical protein